MSDSDNAQTSQEVPQKEQQEEPQTIAKPKGSREYKKTKVIWLRRGCKQPEQKMLSCVAWFLIILK